MYGSPGTDYLYGDFDPEGDYSDEGGDDIIYTGEAYGADYGSLAFGGWGNDKIYGQGPGNDYLVGNWGDDKIWGGDGNDEIHGDDCGNEDCNDAVDDDEDGPADGWDWTLHAYIDYGVEKGDDTIYGGQGEDEIYGGAGNDYLHGEEDADHIVGGAGEDTIWGGEGSDVLYTGSGWDTVFGGPGCDYIYSEDGGDVIWGGDCDPAAEEGQDADGEDLDGHLYQWLFILGTGPEKDNFTVIMDFWHESAMPHNIICLYPGHSQGIPASGACTIEPHFTDDPLDDPTAAESCLTAVDI